ncbi:MAG: DUF3857 domain-containing protein [Planctomycetes bacterium]|nr:DUF3857 domain-containing protein [Planctomycetota bacterium]MCP4772213.1 DUF3857 domain-containing protein [Planctomycetota bacterium]MCP4861269.1 DUF3857 domain-containing protein [Planctomycetota bacterium]
MQTPVRLVLLALLGSCANSASTAPAESPREDNTSAFAEAAFKSAQKPAASVQEPEQEPVKGSAQEPGRKSIFDVARESGQKPATGTAQEPATDNAETSAQEPANGQQAGPPPPPTEADALKLYHSGQTLKALKLYTVLMRDTIAQLREAEAPTTPNTDPNPVIAAQKRAELEWLMVSFRRAAAMSDNNTMCRELLGSLAITETDGMAWAQTRWCFEQSAKDLGKLTDWQFIGPFDNERGVALDSQLAPEFNPDNLATFAGKVRTVTWRTTPKPTPSNGVIDFGQLLNPSQQSAVMLRTWVHSNVDQKVFLMLGIAGEARVWHDGQPVLHAGGEYALQMDSLAAPMQLHSGWNEIAVKLGSRDHTPRIEARFIEASDGRTMHLAHTSTPPEEVIPQMLRSGEPEEVILAPPGAIAYYLATTYVAPENAEAFHRLGSLQRWYGTAPKSLFPGRDDLRRAVEFAPDKLTYRIDYATALFPGEDIDAEEADLNPWLQQAQLVLAEDPGQVQLNIQRVIAALRFQHIENLALDAIARLEGAGHSGPWLGNLKAVVYANFDHDGLAHQVRTQVLNNPQVDQYPKILYPLTRSVLDYGSKEWLTRMRQVYATNQNINALISIIAWQRSQRPAFHPGLELEELGMLRKARPWGARFLREYAKRFQSQNDLDTAFMLVEEALALKPEAAATLALKARLHLQAGQLEDAVTSLEKELEIDFSNDDERRLLDHLQSLDGATFDAPYREDLTNILARHAEDSAEQGSGDYSHEYLLYRSVVRVNPDSTANRYFRKVIRVLNQNGVRQLDEVSFPFSWGDEKLRVLTVNVLHPDGSIETARTDSGWRASRVDLPHLQVGDIIDLEWKVSDLGTTYFGTYFAIDHSMTADRSVPTRESQLALLVPDELPLEFHTIRLAGVQAEVAETESFGTSHTWTVTDLAPQRIENLMPHAEETVARVQASSYESWDEFGAWWWNLIDAGITVSPEMKTKVAELTEGKQSLQEQVAAVYGFVANDIRYNAWEFGVHGYQPYTAPVIFSRQFGDCKDKSILLRAMLSEINVTAYPVLILRSADGRHGGRRHEEDLSLAMVNHFNHCIAYIPAQQDMPAMWVDGTARLHPLDVLPYDDRGAQVLIVKPEGVERVRIPFSEATDNLRAEHYTVAFEEDGSAQVDLYLNPQGRWDPNYRSAFAGGDQDRRETVEQMMSSLLGPLDGDCTYDIQDVEQLNDSLHLLFGAKATSMARVVEGRLEVPSMLNKLNLLQGTTAEATRETDLLLDSPWVRDITIDLTLPKDWNMETLPAPIDAQCDAATYHWSITRTVTGLQVRERLEMLTHRVPVEGYDAFRQLCRIVDDSQDRYLEITPPVTEPPSPSDGIVEAAAKPEKSPADEQEDKQ